MLAQEWNMHVLVWCKKVYFGIKWSILIPKMHSLVKLEKNGICSGGIYIDKVLLRKRQWQRQCPITVPTLGDATQIEPVALLKVSKASTAIVPREVLAKVKDQYIWPPCTNKLVSAHFCFENIIYLFLKMSYPNEVVKGTEPSPSVGNPSCPYRRCFRQNLANEALSPNRWRYQSQVWAAAFLNTHNFFYQVQNALAFCRD